jgi:hypothetical protein
MLPDVTGTEGIFSKHGSLSKNYLYRLDFRDSKKQVEAAAYCSLRDMIESEKLTAKLTAMPTNPLARANATRHFPTCQSVAARARKI